MSKTYYIYIMTNRYHNVLYTGVPSDLAKRVWQHKSKQFKGGPRKRKVDLILRTNPGWEDLGKDIS